MNDQRINQSIVNLTIILNKKKKQGLNLELQINRFLVLFIPKIESMLKFPVPGVQTDSEHGLSIVYLTTSHVIRLSGPLIPQYHLYDFLRL